MASILHEHKGLSAERVCRTEDSFHELALGFGHDAFQSKDRSGHLSSQAKDHCEILCTG